MSLLIFTTCTNWILMPPQSQERLCKISNGGKGENTYRPVGNLTLQPTNEVQLSFSWKKNWKNVKFDKLLCHFPRRGRFQGHWTVEGYLGNGMELCDEWMRTRGTWKAVECLLGLNRFGITLPMVTIMFLSVYLY